MTYNKFDKLLKKEIENKANLWFFLILMPF